MTWERITRLANDLGGRFAARPQDGRHDQLGNFQTALLGRITELLRHPQVTVAQAGPLI